LGIIDINLTVLEDRNEVSALHQMLASILALDGLRHGNEIFPRPICDEAYENIPHKSRNNILDRVIHDFLSGLRTIARERQWAWASSD
jgi:hypothetical protein